MSEPAAILTARQRDVLAHGAAGRSKRQTAAALGISPASVLNYRNAIRRRLGDAAMADLPALAARLGVEVAR